MDNANYNPHAHPIEVVSDFSDYYDKRLLDGDGAPRFCYSRYASNDLSHRDALAFLMDNGFPVPMHGLVQHIPNTIDLVAVYTDDTGRPRGERCDVMPRSDAMVRCPNSFAVEYKGEIGSPSISYREIHIGMCGWLLEYRSEHPWASNQEDAEVTMICQLPWKWDERFGVPVYALDYVDLCGNFDWWNGRYSNLRYYFDLNLYPKIEGTLVADVVSPKRASELIREALARLPIVSSPQKKNLTIPRRASYTKVSDYK